MIKTRPNSSFSYLQSNKQHYICCYTKPTYTITRYQAPDTTPLSNNPCGPRPLPQLSSNSCSSDSPQLNEIPQVFIMCHTVIAQRMCKACRQNLGETVIDFTRCARKCSSPFYALTPEPQMEVCPLCTATARLSTPVFAQHIADDQSPSVAVDVAASSRTSMYSYPFAQSITSRRSEISLHTKAH